MGEPPLANAAINQGGEAGVAEGDPAARSDAIGDIAELFGHQLVKVVEHSFLKEFRMQSRDAIDGMAPDTGQIGHPHGAIAPFIDQ